MGLTATGVVWLACRASYHAVPPKLSGQPYSDRRASSRHRVITLFFGEAGVEEIVLHSEDRGAGPGGDADFRIDMLDMVVRRLWRDRERRANLPVGHSPRGKPEHFD